MTVDIWLYNRNDGAIPNKEIRIPENQTVRYIQIRPNEVAIVCDEQYEDGIKTKLHIFNKENPPFSEYRLT